MSGDISIWTRIKRFFRPQPETYDTRQPRPGEPGDAPGNQPYGATDQRRHGGTGATGGVG